MKNSLRVMGVLILTVLLATSLTACGNGGDGDGGSESTTDNGSSVAYASIIVEDASGQNLGYFIGDKYAYYAFIVYSPSGYMYRIDWTGSLQDASDDIQFSELNCEGTPYMSDMSEDARIYGKLVIYDEFRDKLYRLKSSLITNGYIKANSRILKSHYDTDGTCKNDDSPRTYAIVEVEETTRAEVGIPTTITAPITLNFQ